MNLASRFAVSRFWHKSRRTNRRRRRRCRRDTSFFIQNTFSYMSERYASSIFRPNKIVMADDSRRAREMARREEVRQDEERLRARRVRSAARSEIKYSIDQRQSGYADRQFIPAGVMQIIEIPDNQSGTGCRLLKIRHLASAWRLLARESRIYALVIALPPRTPPHFVVIRTESDDGATW